MSKLKNKLEKTILDKRSKKRRWSLSYRVVDFSSKHPKDSLLKIVEFGADSDKEACEKTLKILKRSAKKTPLRGEYIICLHPSPLPGKFLTSDFLEYGSYGLRKGYSTVEEILKAKDSQQCFGRDYAGVVKGEL